MTGAPNKCVRRPKGSDRYDPKFVVPYVRHPENVMVWGSFSYYSVGNLVIIEGVILDGERYLDLLFENLEESFDNCRAETFMQDGAPCHSTKPVREWLQNCAVDYLQDWPANSPDLNPIENAWGLMKRKL